jgi:hypothetical protein
MPKVVPRNGVLNTAENRSTTGSMEQQITAVPGERLAQGIDSPTIATALQVAGWIVVLPSILIALAGAASDGQSAIVATGIGGAATGILMLGLGAVIDRLHRIERHLRIAAPH